MTAPLIVWSNGGGMQSTAILALIVQGQLPRPDIAIMADTGREKTATWDYVNGVHRPALASVGLDLTVVPHDAARFDLYSGELLLIPAYGRRSGRVGKGKAFCSGFWKRDVQRAHLKGMGHSRYEQWLGISIDESDRAVPSKPRAWVQNRYPLINLGLSRDDCHTIVRDMGWPSAPKSSCWMCPNIGTNEWRHMQRHHPEDFARAVELDAQITAQSDMYLHRSLTPLGHLDLQAQLPLFAEDEVSCSTNAGCWT